MWAVGAVGEVGTLLWVVNAVKAQNDTKQEGAPPSTDPGRAGGKGPCVCVCVYIYMQPPAPTPLRVCLCCKCQ